VTAFLLPAEPVTSLDAYLATETGGRGVEVAQRLGPAATIDAVAASGLRGRGGGGFPTGGKWAGIAAQAGGRHYLVCNGAEGEPGTFKDRALPRANPYQVVEGLIVAAFAIGAEEAFICLKGRFEREIAAVTRAVQEFQSAGICTDCTVNIVAGPQQGWEAGPHGERPRTDQPNPTLVNNVETLANVPHILARGAEWFRSMGTADSPGQMLAEAADRSRTRGADIVTALDEVATTHGHGVAETIRARLAAPGVGRSAASRRRVVLSVLEEEGYEPHTQRDGTIVLRNCPFHQLAQQHTELICGMNHCLVSAAVDAVAGSGLEARLEPEEGL
jgi:NADH:ubiquinone oxidoreductase subunit F (NADH-binding)